MRIDFFSLSLCWRGRVNCLLALQGNVVGDRHAEAGPALLSAILEGDPLRRSRLHVVLHGGGHPVARLHCIDADKASAVDLVCAPSPALPLLRLISLIFDPRWLALSPIWVVGIGCVFMPLFYVCLSVCRLRSITVVLEDRGSSFICWLCTWLFFLGPFLAFIILLASNLTKWKVRAWATVFAPVFVLEALLFCACISYDIIILSDD